MIAFFKNRLNRIAIRTGSTFFLIGHLLFLGYLAFPEESMLGIGLAFMIVFIAIHVLLLATLFLNTLIHFKDYEENLTAFIILSINVPLAILYLNLI